MMNKIENTQPNDESAAASSEARASRLKRLRNLANLSRKELCEDSDIKHDTLIGWEVARHGGLSKTGAQKVISRVLKEGVQCTLEWLLYGTGSGPTFLPNFDKIALAHPELIDIDDEKSIINELAFFRSQHHDTIDHIVEDDSMLPQFYPGDYVAGIKRCKEKIAHLIGYDCIVQLNNEKVLVRRLKEGSKANRYDLLCANIADEESYKLSDVEIICAAPIIWIRRKNPKI